MAASGMSRLVSSADSSLLVVTTAAEGRRAGCLVGFHTPSSMSPEAYCFWLSKANHTYRVSLRSTHFGLHFLTAGDVALAEHFGARSGEDGEKFSGVEHEIAQSGVPLVSALPHRMLVKRIATLDDGGDHVCITARVVTAESRTPFTPLRTSDVSHIVPGHDSDERVIRP
ncbi:MAG TPA: flavin reductase [Brevibacterium sp.]|nr:flavin reductase [Brevibacterium sp.]HLS33002.1 flavin reductase [Brevibacterium sp.]